MVEAIYILCALTSIACAVMLFRGFGRTGSRLLLWSGVCFAFLGLNNAMLFLDRVIYPDNELIFAGVSVIVWRSVAAVLGISVLIYGLVWDTE